MTPENTSLTILLISLGVILFVLAVCIISEERKKMRREMEEAIKRLNLQWMAWTASGQYGDAPDGLTLFQSPNSQPNRRRFECSKQAERKG